MAAEIWGIYQFLKTTVSLFKLIELSDKGINNQKDFASKIKNEDKFDEIFNHLEFNFDLEKIQNTFEFDHEDIALAIRLIYALAYRYITDEEFNSIRMQADHLNTYGALSMDDYFITPSYIPEEDLRKRESLINAEKETSNIKIERMKAKFLQNFLPHEYISNSLFLGINRVVITGNPGVGKSTYSRWLCYNWAQQKLNIKGILLHINLRLLEFGKENSIAKYLSKIYLKGADTNRLQKILSTINQDFYFVLDGFDELDDIQQKKLKNDLYQLGSETKFILLSRPYGLLNNQGLNWDFSFQIDGFNNSNIYNYIDQFLALNGRQSKRDTLLKIIEDNRVLEDYAHNPLMLSYITYLFLEEKHPEKKLAKVHSQYDLQDLAFSWIRNHEEKKKTKIELDKLMTESMEFAYQMEINKTIVLHNSETLNPNSEIATYLSRIGLGKKQSSENHLWQFSFNTLTFQEFLASRFLGQCINPKAFLYLTKDKYYWNFSKMLIGYLSKQGQESTIDAILQAHLQNLEKEQTTNHWYFYVMYLSETAPSFLKNELTKRGIENIYVSFKTAFWDNPVWKPMLLEAIARIYSKSSLVIKTKLQSLILNDFKNMLSPYNHGGTPIIEHAKALVIKLRLENELSFLKKIMLLQTQTLDNLYSDAYPDYIDIAHEGLIFLFEKVICKALPENILNYRAELETLIDKTIDIFVIAKAKLQLYFVDPKNLPQKLISDYKNLEKFLSVYKKDQDQMLLQGENLIRQLVLDIYHVAHFQEQYTDEERTSILSSFSKAIPIFFDGMNHAEIDDFDQDEIGELLIKGLVKFNEASLYDTIIESALVINPSYLIINIPDNKAFFEYMDSLLKTKYGELDQLAMDKLMMCLNIVENARNQFARFRERFADILTDYIKIHNTAFEQSKGGYVQAQQGTIEADNYEITRKFNSILDSTLSDDVIFEYDKKYLIDRFADFHHYNYFRKYFNPQIWGRGFNLYQKEYWELILEYRKDIENLPALITILRNPQIYLYISNLPHIQQVFSYLLKLSLEETPENFPVRLIEMLSRTINLIKTAEKNPLLIHKEEMLELIIALVEKYQLSHSFPEIDLDQLEGRDILLFILLYYFTEDEQYNVIQDYDDFLENHKSERRDFMNKLLNLFTENEILLSHELSKLDDTLGKNMVKRLKSLIILRPELVEAFDKEIFEQYVQIEKGRK